MRMGVYSSFQSGGPGVRSYIMFDILGGNIRGNSGTSKDQINSMLSSLNSYQNTSWAGYFYILYQVNNLIKAAENTLGRRKPRWHSANPTISGHTSTTAW